MKKILVLLTGIVMLYSCKKNDVSSNFSPPLLSITDSSPVYNYFLLRTTQLSDSTDTTLQVQALSTFWDEHGNKVPIISISVNGRMLGQNADHSLSLNYIDSASLQEEGKAFAGTNLQVRVTGTSASDTANNLVYVPKKLIEHPKAFLDSPIHVGVKLPLSWVPDPNNPLGTVTIQVIYDALKSTAANPIFPPQLDPLTFVVDDNGSFTIPDNALAYFPVGAYISFHIARVSEIKSVLPVSGKKVYYWGVSDFSTPSVVLLPGVQ